MFIVGDGVGIPNGEAGYKPLEGDIGWRLEGDIGWMAECIGFCPIDEAKVGAQ